jgi:hypothetical protein
MVAEISGRSRSIEALAWRFLSESESAGVDQVMREVAEQTDQADRGLRTLGQNVTAIDRSTPVTSLDDAHQAFARVRQMLIGPSGVAAAVKLSIRKQREAETLLSTALESLHLVARSGAIRSSEAETAQNQSLSPEFNVLPWVVFSSWAWFHSPPC